MEKVGVIKYYVSGSGSSSVDVSFDGKRYKIHLGLFGEDSKYENSVAKLSTHLYNRFKNRKGFKIKSVEVDIKKIRRKDFFFKQ